jgi:hypothetical protein
MKTKLVPSSQIKPLFRKQENPVCTFISMVKLIHETTVASVHYSATLFNLQNLSNLHALNLFLIILKTSGHYVLYVNGIHSSNFVRDIMCFL